MWQICEKKVLKERPKRAVDDDMMMIRVVVTYYGI
jgi:hypothetical protein